MLSKTLPSDLLGIERLKNRGIFSVETGHLVTVAPRFVGLLAGAPSAATANMHDWEVYKIDRNEGITSYGIRSCQHDTATRRSGSCVEVKRRVSRIKTEIQWSIQEFRKPPDQAAP